MSRINRYIIREGFNEDRPCADKKVFTIMYGNALGYTCIAEFYFAVDAHEYLSYLNNKIEIKEWSVLGDK